MLRRIRGFSLIELLIVVAIITILAALAVPAFMGFTKKAKRAEIINTMGAIRTAEIAYRTEDAASAYYTFSSITDAVATKLGLEFGSIDSGYVKAACYSVTDDKIKFTNTAATDADVKNIPNCEMNIVTGVVVDSVTGTP